MACGACEASHAQGLYSHCTCYLHIVHGVAPSSSMMANDWFNTCTLSVAPTDTTNYLIASSSHVAIRKGAFYYYHNGSRNQPPKQKPLGTTMANLGMSGTVKYKKL